MRGVEKGVSKIENGIVDVSGRAKAKEKGWKQNSHHPIIHCRLYHP